MTAKMKPALYAKWSTRDQDIVFGWDRHPTDGHLLHGTLTALSRELKVRGYDLTTLRFSIRRKVVTP